MPEESTTPDLVELVGRSFESAGVRDFEALISFYDEDAVWDLSSMGLGVYRGRAAIRRFYEDWMAAYDQFAVSAEEIVDLGNGVAFSVFVQDARPVGSRGHVGFRYGSVSVWTGGLAVRVVNYTDIDEGRAAAERLAEERG